MKTIKQSILIMLAVMIVANLVSYFILGTSDKKIPPEISCPNEILEVSAGDSEEALLEDVTAFDAQDGDLTGKLQLSGVSKMLSDHRVKASFVVFDSDHNLASHTRMIRYTDYTAPRFSVEEPLIYNRSEAISLLDRIRATDCIQGDITEFVRTSDLTATSEPEVYTVDLQVTNSMGDTARLTLPVIRQEGIAIRPEVKLSQYLVYLERGSAFRAKDYLVYVSTPEGIGDKEDVQISGSVDTSTPGTYMVHYTYPLDTTSGTSVLTVVVE